MGKHRLIILLFVFVCMGCQQKLYWPSTQSLTPRKTGEQFYSEAMHMLWKQRDSFAVKEILGGNIPQYLFKLVPIKVTVYDSTTRKVNRVTYYVMPDYLSVGSNANWARIPLTPISAQLIADSLQCFLPTRKMVNDIHNNAVVKLAPVPMYVHRDSTVTMWQHHLIVEGQRRLQKGLIAGIKKDVVISDLLTRSAKSNRVAIYGWHQLNGIPIQPLYSGHVNWYVDYSHGIRLISRNIKVNGKWMDYAKLMQHPVLKKALTDESFGDVIRY